MKQAAGLKKTDGDAPLMGRRLIPLAAAASQLVRQALVLAGVPSAREACCSLQPPQSSVLLWRCRGVGAPARGGVVTPLLFLCQNLKGTEDHGSTARSVSSTGFYLNPNNFVYCSIFRNKYAFPFSKMFLKNIMFETKFYINIAIIFLKNNVFVFNKVG